MVMSANIQDREHHKFKETTGGDTSILWSPASNLELDLARKHITGQRSLFFFGENDAIGTTYEDVWPKRTSDR